MFQLSSFFGQPLKLLGFSRFMLLHQRTSPGRTNDDRLFDVDSVELLEERQLLAGDVSVVVANNGDVRITGDNNDNQITFIRDGNAQLYVLGEDGTTIDGLLTAALMTTEIERRLIINTRGGDDFIRLNDVGIDGDVVINGGSGDDLVFVIDSGMQKLTVNTASGSDMIVLSDNYIEKKTALRTGGDNDFVFIDRCNRLFDDVSIATAGGDDRVFLAGANFYADVNTSTGSGADAVILRNPQVVGSFNARAGGGSDAFVVSGTPPTANELFHGGAGTDGYIGQTSEPIPETQSVEDTFAVPMVNINGLSEVFKNEFVARGGQLNEMLCNIILP